MRSLLLLPLLLGLVSPAIANNEANTKCTPPQVKNCFLGSCTCLNPIFGDDN